MIKNLTLFILSSHYLFLLSKKSNIKLNFHQKSMNHRKKSWYGNWEKQWYLGIAKKEGKQIAFEVNNSIKY